MRKLFWAALGGFATCLGIVADLPVLADGVKAIVENVLPIATNLVPIVAFWGAITFGGLLLTSIVKRIPRALRWYFELRDRWGNFDPDAEQFHEYLPRLKHCRDLMVGERYNAEEQHIRLVLELRALERDLKRLGIEIPAMHSDYPYASPVRLRLQQLIVLAERRDIEAARQPYDVGEFL